MAITNGSQSQQELLATSDIAANSSNSFTTNIGNSNSNIVIRHVPFYVQAVACLLRCFLQTIHQLTTLLGDLILNAIGGFIIAALFSGNLVFQGQSSKSIYDSCPSQMKEICGQPNVDSITGFTGTLVLAMSLTSIMSSLKIFGAEKVNFRKREIESGINTMVYYFTKCIYSLIYIVLDALFFTLAFYFIVKPRETFGFYFSFTFLAMFTTFPIGYIISTLLSESVAQITCVVFIFINYMFAGLTPSLPELSGMPLPFPFLPYLSFLRYLNELLYVHEIAHYNNMFEKSISLKGYVRELDNFYISMILSFAFVFYFIGALVIWQSCPDSLCFSIKYQGERIIQWILLKYHEITQKIKCCKKDD
ncbi:predicted protein [Naegleria gruberi]|uniref:Predicted protein n=1 Tax=Naegleria gruberi TaxID=5762 RepID=D2VBP4_NAEGR|nr:uncharacterized protein NAEGRDRAFT_66287 [Naegleria gruberi]EFC45944.1 predicted protein [Naegleria gruberi]|eukprot:XP_002678688.1 predicted protein [Naegleria gruberi strain NEG-M]